MKSILIKGGEVISDKKKIRADVLINGGIIIDVSPSITPPENVEIIDASGKYVAPGFIDAHSHADVRLTYGYDAINLLSQGITTIIVGNCGVSAMPVPGNNAILQNTDDKKWDSLEEYLDELTVPVNVGFLLGQGSLRASVMGNLSRAATPPEIQKMIEIGKFYLENGFLGVSSGLIYAPGIFTTEDEMVELLKGLHPRLYKTHLRNEGPNVVDAVKEALRVAHRADVPLQIAHHKAAGKDNWGLTRTTVDLVDLANSGEMDVGMEVYLYQGAHTSLRVVIPKSLYENEPMGLSQKFLREIQFDEEAERISNLKGIHTWCENDWDDVVVTLSRNPKYRGRTISNIAEEKGLTPYQAAVGLLIEDPLIKATFDNMMSEEDIINVLTYPKTIVASDGFVYDSSLPEMCHPRNYGNFVRLLHRYPPHILTLEEAVDKITRMPAERYGLRRRGSIRKGYKADLVLFDVKSLRDTATVHNPTSLSEGVEMVFVNGNLAYDGISVKKYYGEVLLK